MDRYKIVFSKQAEKAYARLSGKIQIGVDRCLETLSEAPVSQHPDIKRLKGRDNAYRYRVGGWRVIYYVYEDMKTVLVTDIGPRGDVYKN